MPTVYNGSHLTMPGLARYISTGPGQEIKPFQLAPHQLNVIWRTVSSGNTLIDHAVGAGKTFSMIGAGQEQRRLGLIRRPMYVVPNHMLEQFAREFLQAYPAAEILAADKESMTKDKRRAFSARLVEKGIPREQIAFIHEADNDVKKGRLFASVREGLVRILIGSTAKMGVGTNVQRQLVAMHHLDAPWRPADVEQRDGRILRQGNENEEVEVFRYITRRSLDAYRWQTLNRKAAFIAQLRAGARTAEDIDSPLPEAAMIKAAATGNPLIIEHAELSKELRELEAAKRGHERSTIAAKTGYERLRGRIAGHEKAIPGLSSDAAQAIKSETAPFAITIGGRHTARKSWLTEILH